MVAKGSQATGLLTLGNANEMDDLMEQNHAHITFLFCFYDFGYRYTDQHSSPEFVLTAYRTADQHDQQD